VGFRRRRATITSATSPALGVPRAAHPCRQLNASADGARWLSKSSRATDIIPVGSKRTAALPCFPESGRSAHGPVPPYAVVLLRALPHRTRAPIHSLKPFIPVSQEICGRTKAKASVTPSRSWVPVRLARKRNAGPQIQAGRGRAPSARAQPRRSRSSSSPR